MYRFLQKHFGIGKTEAESASGRHEAAPARLDGNVGTPRAPEREGHQGLARVMASPTMAGNEYTPEGDVDRTLLAETFSRCFFAVDFDTDGDLWVRDADGLRVLVVVESERRVIRFTVFYRFQDESSEHARMALACRCNDEVMMVRFRTMGAEAFVADYILSYERGLLLCQLVHSFRLFTRITMAAVRQADRDNILR